VESGVVRRVARDHRTGPCLYTVVRGTLDLGCRQVPDRFDVGNTQSVLEPYHSFCIFTEILAFSIYDQLLDLIDFLIILLTFLDVLL
jgi:hypothetical protein